MDYPFSCCHPLDIPWTYHPLVSFEILMGELSFKHVGHSLESSVRVVWEPSWQFDMEVIQHQERVQSPEVLVAQNPDDSGPFAFILPFGFENHSCEFLHLSVFCLYF